jgi:transcriptional regulator with PAS, ATPase and Fis domain
MRLKNLGELVKQNVFREDLYYRINVIKLVLPPLRERKEDIPLLVEHFIGRFNKLQGKNINGITPEGLSIVMKCDFPGNVRELQNIIEHAFVVCHGRMIEPKHLPSHLYPESTSLTGENGGVTPLYKVPAALATSLEELEARFIISALKRNNWNRAATARELGINKSTLYRKLKLLQIELPEKDGRSRRQ